jgi:N-acetylglutamate synthase
MNVSIRKMNIDDYEEILNIWKNTEGMSLEEDDSLIGITLYLNRNPNSCFVATFNSKIVGTVLSGHEGRRGILRHLAVSNEFRNNGISTKLVNKALLALNKEGIRKCNIFVLDENISGIKYWEHNGWKRHKDSFSLMYKDT